MVNAENPVFMRGYEPFALLLITVDINAIILCIRWLWGKGIIILWIVTVKIHMMKPLAVCKCS